MPNFVWLREGDRLPAVAAVQVLLNRAGASLDVDGDFGTQTKDAVEAFQDARPGLTPDGVIGSETWPRLSANANLPIVDCIDVFDPSLYQLERRFLRGIGANPITIGGMSNGIEQAVRDIASRYSDVFLLRFHGHGAPGVAGVSDGEGDVSSASSFEDDRATHAALSRLRRVFGPYGCIQYMHCETGRGREGARFLGTAADATGVPNSAAYNTQYAGSLRETMRYEGATRSVCPSGQSLRNWANARPAMAPFSPT